MRVLQVDYVNKYKVKLLFSDKKEKVVDIEPIINKGRKIFQPLKDVEYFKKVSLDDDVSPSSICWPNGADICPDVLYEMGKDLKKKASGKPTKRPSRRANHVV